MSIGSTIMKGLGVVSKAAPVAGIALGALPLIRDFLSSPTVDQDKLSKVKAARDNAASQMAGEMGVSYDKALEMVDREFQPLIDQASQPQGGRDWGNIGEDAAGLGLDALVFGGAAASRLFGKGGSPAANAAKDSSGVLTEAAIASKTPQNVPKNVMGSQRPASLAGMQDGPVGGTDPYAPPGSGLKTPPSGLGGADSGDGPMPGRPMSPFPSAGGGSYAPPGSGRNMPMPDGPMPMGDGPSSMGMEEQAAMQQMGSMGMPGGYGGGTPEMQQAIEALAQEHADQSPPPMPVRGLNGGPSRGPFAPDAVQAWQQRPQQRSKYPGEWQADPWGRKPLSKPDWETH